MTAWIVIVAVAAGSYVLRVTMLLVLSGREVRGQMAAALRLIGPATTAALVAAAVLLNESRPAVTDVPRLLATAVGFVAVRRSGKLVHAFTLGLPVYAGLLMLG